MNTAPSEKTQPLLYVIVFLLVLNVGITGWLAFSNTQERVQADAIAELPDALGADERNRLFEDFREAFSSGDLQATFEVLHPLARISMSADQTKKVLSGLRTSFGAIDEYIYSHFTYGGYNNGFHTYSLIYSVKYSGGKSGATKGR